MIFGEFHDCRGELLVSQYRKKWWGTLLSFRKVLVRKKFMEKKGVSHFSVDVSLPQNAEKHRGRTLLRFRNILVSKDFR